jgi:hypothetical protein
MAYPQQYRTAIESPREFGKASGAMDGAQKILIATQQVYCHLTGVSEYIIMQGGLTEIMDMVEEAVSCQTQTLALLEKIKAHLCDH